MSEATLTKVEPSSVIIEHVLAYEESMQLLPVNFKRFMCLVIDSECSEGANRNPSRTDLPNESTTVVTTNDKSCMFVLRVLSINTKSLKTDTSVFDNGLVLIYT